MILRRSLRRPLMIVTCELWDGAPVEVISQPEIVGILASRNRPHWRFELARSPAYRHKLRASTIAQPLPGRMHSGHWPDAEGNYQSAIALSVDIALITSPFRQVCVDIVLVVVV